MSECVRTKLSAREQKMFLQLGLTLLLDQPITVDKLYHIALQRVFATNQKGLAVKAFRRCANALWDHSVARGTKRFEKLIGEL